MQRRSIRLKASGGDEEGRRGGEKGAGWKEERGGNGSSNSEGSGGTRVALVVPFCSRGISGAPHPSPLHIVLPLGSDIMLVGSTAFAHVLVWPEYSPAATF